MSNEVGIQIMREWRERQTHAAAEPPPYPCPACGSAVSMVFGRHRKAFNGFHDSTTACQFRDCIWHMEAVTEAEARFEWKRVIFKP